MNSQKFQYKGSINIDYRGCFFHSLLELKYAIRIESDHAYLRGGIEIYYDEKKQESTLHIHENIKKYTPDFLIRNIHTNEAFLIEIKPRDFDDYEYLSMVKNVSEHFIKAYNYDWKFLVVYSDEIHLSDAQFRLFRQLSANNNNCEAKMALQRMENKFNKHAPEKIFHSTPITRTGLSPEQYRMFVRRGVAPAVRT